MYDSRDPWEPLAYLVALAIAITLIIWGLIIIGIIWLLVAGIVAAYRYKKWLREAEQDYQRVEDEIGAGYEADDVFRAVWGAGVELNDDGWEGPMDFLDETVFGMRTDV